MPDSGCSDLFISDEEKKIYQGQAVAPKWDGANGKKLEDATVYLHPYWIARYFGLIGD
jgi:hypothetical protein